MTYLEDILSMLAFRPRSLRELASRRLVVPAVILLAAGFFTFVFVRSHMTQEVPARYLGRFGFLGFLLDSHVLQMLLFLALIYVPAVAALSNAFSGDGLGFSISRSEYTGYVSALFPLWGMIFLTGAPLVPYFVPVGILEISLGELWLLLATTVYTIWAIRELGLILFGTALGVFVISWITLPILFVLTNYLLVLPIFIILPLLLVFIQRFRDLLATRTLLRGFHQHLGTLRQNPRDAAAHFELGLLHFRGGHLDAARGYFEQSLSIDPEDPAHHYYMGRIHEVGGDWIRAADEYEATYRLNAEYAQGDIFREVGKGYLHTGKLDKALEFLRFFLEHHSTDPEGRYWLGAALNKAGRTDEMRVQLNTVLDQARRSSRTFRRENREWISRSRTLLRSS
jgi:hypothetical protein